MFTAAAARERRMSTVPTRAATARWRSVQSSWATAHPNSRPLAMTNVPVRKIAAGTWRTSALSTPQTRKPANHHCPGGCAAGACRRSVAAASSRRTARPDPRRGIRPGGPARGARSGGRTAPPTPPARLWRGDWRTRMPAPPRCPAPPAPAAARPQPHPRERPLPAPTPTRRPDRVVPSGATDVPDRSPHRWRIRARADCRHRDRPRRPSIATPVLDAARRPRSTLPLSRAGRSRSGGARPMLHSDGERTHTTPGARRA